jgi:hypothetical protein
MMSNTPTQEYSKLTILLTATKWSDMEEDVNYLLNAEGDKRNALHRMLMPTCGF